jgi:hypothetical protein
MGCHKGMFVLIIENLIDGLSFLVLLLRTLLTGCHKGIFGFIIENLIDGL